MGTHWSLAVESSSPLRADDWVEVRTKDEILRTLDESGRLEGLPFMPEMFEYCGKQFKVAKRAHKSCDTVSGACDGLSMPRAVHLEGLRCNGGAHGGCDAGCTIFWKDAWLKPIQASRHDLSDCASGADANADATRGANTCTEETVWARTVSSLGEEPVYSCQATLLLEATRVLKWWDVRQYLEDYRSGNVGVGQLLAGAGYVMAERFVRLTRRVGNKLGFDLGSRAIRVYDFVQRLRGGVPFPRKPGLVPVGQRTPGPPGNLRPKMLVRVKSHEQILATLDAQSKNRGLYFDAEHVPYCGGTYRVRSLVSQLIDEKTGKMIRLKTPSIILEDVVCQAYYSYRRMHCPRALYPYFREVWLEPVDEPRAPVIAAATGQHHGNSSADATQ
jgi:hypothetical protein